MMRKIPIYYKHLWRIKNRFRKNLTASKRISLNKEVRLLKWRNNSSECFDLQPPYPNTEYMPLYAH